MCDRTPLPDVHYISIQLAYRPHTPEEYEPKFFKAATEYERQIFPEPSDAENETPGTCVGKLQTKFHCMRVKVQSAKDGIGFADVDMDPDPEEKREDCEDGRGKGLCICDWRLTCCFD